MKYKISDLTKILDISQNTVRRYEERGYISPERNEKNGYRKYDDTDIYKIFTARIYRKFGFSLDDIFTVINSDVKGIKAEMNKKNDEIDKEIERLKRVKRRLKDNLRLVEMLDEYTDSYFVRDCVPFSIVIMRKNDKMYPEEERAEVTREFMKYAPDVKYACIIDKNNVTENRKGYEVGLAVKTEMLDDIKGNKYITDFPKKPTIITTIKMNGGLDSYLKEHNYDEIFKGAYEYMEKEGLEIDGDILGLSIASTIEKEGEVEWVLMSIPVKKIVYD